MRLSGAVLDRVEAEVLSMDEATQLSIREKVSLAVAHYHAEGKGLKALQSTRKLCMEFGRDQKGGVSIGALFGTLIFVLVLAQVIPIAIDAVTGADTSGWDAGSVALWGVLGLVIVAGALYMVAKHMGLLGGE